MVRHRSEMGVALAQVLEQVSVIDAQPPCRMQSERRVSLVLVPDLRNPSRGGVEIYACAGNKEPREFDLLDPGGGSLNPPERLRIVRHFGQAAVVLGAKVDVIVGKRMEVDPGAAGQVDAEARHHK